MMHHKTAKLKDGKEYDERIVPGIERLLNKGYVIDHACEGDERVIGHVVLKIGKFPKETIDKAIRFGFRTKSNEIWACSYWYIPQEISTKQFQFLINDIV
jgi:hypothetical protein